MEVKTTRGIQESQIEIGVCSISRVPTRRTFPMLGGFVGAAWREDPPLRDSLTATQKATLSPL